MPKKNESYEDMMVKLEDIVRQMDGDKMPLSDSIKKYEEGMKLCTKMYKVLKEAEGKINILTEEGEKNLNFKEGK
ncbi:exodeoxyribonuclease VII small subunit [Clostridium algifaecis]|uniref:Exodeoxyribonuclease 7 small subunit n=1 Tax=Clostridium algifaecis TaxID=1472040 RepID=A0ABS4KN63_9CLOT|nr:exodeoxyribonuclease VII small subunit [Clostridium algifaecis]